MPKQYTVTLSVRVDDPRALVADTLVYRRDPAAPGFLLSRKPRNQADAVRGLVGNLTVEWIPTGGGAIDVESVEEVR